METKGKRSSLDLLVEPELKSSDIRSRYVVSLLRSLYGEKLFPRLKVLDIGCGIGAVVDRLSKSVGECWGIEPGWRADGWKQLDSSGRLLVATGEALPFPDNYFDFCTSFGVIEHVGCTGWAMMDITESYWELRKHFASEIMRVLKVGGCALISCPNKLFPLDFWHSPRLFRFHAPWEKVLPSYAELRRLFLTHTDSCIRLLPQRGFFGFARIDRKARGGSQILKSVAKLSLAALDRLPSLSRYIAPQLVVLVTKGGKRG